MSEDIKTVRLVLNSDQAAQKLDDINKKLETAREKKLAAFEKGDGKALQVYTKEIRTLEREQRKLQTRAETVSHVLESLDRATPKDLKNVIREINKELDSGSIARGSKEWNALTNQLKAARAELKKINKESEADTKSLTDRLKDFGDYWVGFAATAYTAIQGLTGIKDMVRSSVQEFAEMEEHMSGVKKYTGLSSEGVRELNEAFKKMDTRTARTALNDLAGDAGRLGIQAKEQILDFVSAADQINVALGEDLGEDAVKNIGKLAQLFGDADKVGLKRAMLSTGSLINDLAQSSSASEGYLMEFTARLAGVGHQAGMSQAQVMAFGSILDQSMVNVEKGATALQNVITGLYTKPAELARIAGLDVKKFTDLLKTDGNAAVVQFIQALHDGGGLDKLAPALEKMQLSGAGVTQVLSSLANNVDALRATQKQATAAFAEGTSVTKEFEVANNTVQAQLEKNKQRFQDLSVELGESLLPLSSHLVGVTGTMMQILIRLIPFVSKHAAEIVSLSAVIATYVAVANLAAIKTKAAAVAQIAWNKALAFGKTMMAAGTTAARLMQLAYFKVTRQTDKATLAQARLNATMMKNPYAAVAAAVVALGSAIYLLTRKTKELNTEQRTQAALAKAMERGAQKADDERARLTRLNNILHDHNLKLKDRLTALREIQRIVPDYHGALSKEGRLINDNTDAITAYIGKLTQMAQAQALEQELQEQYKRKFALERDQKRKENNVRAVERELGKDAYKPDFQLVQSGPMGAHGSMESHYEDMNERRRKKKTEELNAQKGALGKINGELSQTAREISAIEKQMKTLGVSTDVIVKAAGKDGASGGGGFNLTTTEEAEKALKKRAQAIKDAAEAQRILRKVELDSGIIDHREYTRQISAIDVKMYEDLKSVYAKNSTDYIEAEKKRVDSLAALKKNERAWSLKDLQIRETEERENVKQNYIHGLIDEKQYKTELANVHLEFLRRKTEMTAQWGSSEEAKAAEMEYEQASNDEKLARLTEFWKKVDSFKKSYLAKSQEEQMADELAFAKQLLAKKLLSEEEYAKVVKEIRERYSEGGSGPIWNGGGPSDPMASGVVNLIGTIQKLQENLANGKAGWQDYASVAVASLGMVSAVASSASQLVQANMAIEEKKINQRYDAEIKKAGRNRKKKKQLEEQKEKDIAKMKSKYAKKAMAMQIAQAIASTASNAILAYGSVLMRGVPWTYPLAAIAAATAVASGMIQVAAIKKQADAQSEGYYSGGFTGGNNYHREAGVVHEGEFVANHHAVGNPNLAPVLRLIDHAQRTNTIASLSAADVSRAVSAPIAASAAPATVINVDSAKTNETLDRLADRLDEPIKAFVVLNGVDGLDNQWKRYNKMKSV